MSGYQFGDFEEAAIGSTATLSDTLMDSSVTMPPPQNRRLYAILGAYLSPNGNFEERRFGATIEGELKSRIRLILDY